MTVLPTIRRQLLEVAERSAEARTPALSWPGAKWRVPRRLVLATSQLATAALIVITVVVAVGAIILLGQNRHSPAAAGSSARSTRQQLVQTLGVLRKGATVADRRVTGCIERFGRRPGGSGCLRYVPEQILIAENPAPVASSFLASSGRPRWDLTLIRTVPMRALGGTVSLYPGSWQPPKRAACPGFGGPCTSPPPRSEKRTWGVVAGLATFANHGLVESPPTDLRTLRAHGIVLLPYAGSSATIRVAIIVPDGVTRIAVAAVSLGGQHWLENDTAAVDDNVAAVQLKTPGSRFDGLQSAAVRMTWSDARGEVIRRTTTAMQG